MVIRLSENNNFKPRLLLVDDVPANLHALVELLQDRFVLQFARTGKDALLLLERFPLPDLILLDVMMPDMNGYSVCREVKRNVATQHIPIIFITALDDVPNELLGFEVGAADYIIKPFEAHVALARITNQLRIKLGGKAAEGSLPGPLLQPSLAESDNIFHYYQGTWHLAFQGEPIFQLKYILGLVYLHQLIRHVNTEFSVEKLVFMTSKREREKFFQRVMLAGWVADVEVLRVRTEYVLERSVASPECIGNAEVDLLLDEIEQRGVLTCGGEMAMLDRERYRKSVGNAVRRAMGEIALHSPALAQHLQYPNLRMGYELIYAPREHVVWKS